MLLENIINNEINIPDKSFLIRLRHKVTPYILSLSILAGTYTGGSKITNYRKREISPKNNLTFQLSNLDYKKIHKEIEDLVMETFSLWYQNRVGFQWRNYLPNHTLRVSAMCIELGRREGGNLTELEFAGTLHDITKPYSGIYLTGEGGKRIIDKNGFWKNEVLMPARNNIVTELYDKYDLYGSIHHISGAFIARKILERYELDQGFIDNVCSIINAHIKPLNHTSGQFNGLYNKIENQIIYDADTMDANLGYVAFFRNVHIHAHRAIQRGGFNMEKYIGSIGQWIERKQSFADGLFTESARKIAEKRQDRKRRLYKELIEEKENFDLNMKYGMLGVIDYFVSQTANPNFSEELSYLQKKWIPERRKWIEEDYSINSGLAKQSLSRVINFCKTIFEESQGKK